MTSEFAYEASDEASENELLDRSLSVWRGWSAIEWEDFTPIALDIHTACSIGQYDWVRSLIARNDGLALDRKNHGGWTPLMYACYIGHDNIVNLLINAGCHMNMKNPRGHTPLILAASCGNESVARTLIRNGAELELTDKCGWTALFHATYAGHQNFVAYLLETGANTDAVEPVTGMTPFMEAASEGHEIIAQLFLQHGVNVNAKAYNGDMARSLALINGYMKIVSLIDNYMMPLSSLRSEPDLDFYLSSSDDGQPKPRPSNVRNGRGKSKGPSIRDGPEAIARMINRTRNTDILQYTAPTLPKGYVSFSGAGEVKGQGTHLSHRDVTSPINPDDYKDNSGNTDFDDDNDESNAFTKTGAITIKSSSSSSGGLIAALGLSREGSIDSDDSHSVELANSSPDRLSHVDDTEKRVEMPKDDDELCPSSVNVAEMTQDQPFSFDSETNEDTNDGTKPEDHGGAKVNKGANLSPIMVSAEDIASACKEKEKPWAVVSPLRDYFPLEIPFQVNFTSAPTSSTQNVIPMGGLTPSSHEQNTNQLLPQDDMTQAEIVSRYLSHLNLEADTNRSIPTDIANLDVTQQSLNATEQSLLNRQTDHVSHIESVSSNTSSNIQNSPAIGNPGCWIGGSFVPFNQGVMSPQYNSERIHDSSQIPLNSNINGSKVMTSHSNENANLPLQAQAPCQPLPNSDQSTGNHISHIFDDRMSQNSSAALETEGTQQLSSPYVHHHHQPPPPFLLPSSHHHHHHHHHFHGSQQQPQDILNSHPPSSVGDQLQHYHQGHCQMPGSQNYISNVPGFYNLQQHVVTSIQDSHHPMNVHPYLQTVPPELYYRDFDAGPHFPTKNVGHTLNTNPPQPLFPGKYLSHGQSSDSLSSVNNPKRVEESSHIHLQSNPDHNLTSEHGVPAMSRHSHNQSSSFHHTDVSQGFQSDSQAAVPSVSNLSDVSRDNVASSVSSLSVVSRENVSPSSLSSRNTSAFSSIKNEKHDNPTTAAKTSTVTTHSHVVQRQMSSLATNPPRHPLPSTEFGRNINEVLKDRQQIPPVVKTTSNLSSGNSSTPPASVMIPGHATSQPISQSIAWLNQSGQFGGGPKDLREMLTQLGLTKYLDKFEEQDVDLPVFLSLTDNDLKELGIKLFGPRKKMTNAIARWHSKAPLSCSELEQAYADRLEGEMQEMAIQLNQACANEESLKAQVLQEQQLRSVTESCLMEMRMSWCQTRQLIQDTRSTMRTMGELLSRLRHNQKELKKSVVAKTKEQTQASSSKTGNGDASLFASRQDLSEAHKDTVANFHKTKSRNEQVKNVKKDSLQKKLPEEQGEKGVGTETGTVENVSSMNSLKHDKEGFRSASFDSLSLELAKKSEKCVKDLQQALSSLVHNADHILKSTQNMNTLEKDLT